MKEVNRWEYTYTIKATKLPLSAKTRSFYSQYRYICNTILWNEKFTMYLKYKYLHIGLSVVDKYVVKSWMLTILKNNFNLVLIGQSK